MVQPQSNARQRGKKVKQNLVIMMIKNSARNASITLQLNTLIICTCTNIHLNIIRVTWHILDVCAAMLMIGYQCRVEHIFSNILLMQHKENVPFRDVDCIHIIILAFVMMAK